MTERYCKDCKWFCDAHYDRTYITPRCNVQGSDDASFMRRFICTRTKPNQISRSPRCHCPPSAGFFTCEGNTMKAKPPKMPTKKPGKGKKC